MTRETKVGLVVAGSFLCLVAVVVASRWNRGPEPEEPAVTQVKTTAEDEQAKKEKDKGPKDVFAAAVQQADLKLKNAPEAPKPNDEKPPPLFADATPKPQGPDVSLPGGLPAVPPVVQAPDQGFKPAFDASIEESQKKALEDLRAAKSPPTVAFPGKPVEGPPPPVAPNDLKLFSGAQPVPVALDQKNDTPPPAPFAEKLPAAPPPGLFANPKKEEPPVPPAVEQFAQAAPVKPVPSVENNLPAPPIVPPPTDSFAKPPTPVAPPEAKQNDSIFPPPAPIADVKPKNPEPQPTIPGLNKGPNTFTNTPTDPNLPPLGFNPAPAVPQVTIRPTGGTLPQVKSFTPDKYVCQPEDTSFAVLSSRKYGSAKYAKALLQYNREHPSAAANLRLDNPRLQAGQEVFLPPADFLEQRYTSFLDNFAGALPVSISPPANPSAGTPPPSTPTVGRIPTVVPTRDATKAYRVPGQGQMLIEIAQQTLGDRGRWSEIYRLNPTLRPEYPIPGGTEIRLPINANVP